jgi:hypothetical protein
MSCLPGARFSVEGVFPINSPSTSISQFAMPASMVTPGVVTAAVCTTIGGDASGAVAWAIAGGWPTHHLGCPIHRSLTAMGGVRYCTATISALTRIAPLATFMLRVQTLYPAFFTKMSCLPGSRFIVEGVFPIYRRRIAMGGVHNRPYFFSIASFRCLAQASAVL